MVYCVLLSERLIFIFNSVSSQVNFLCVLFAFFVCFSFVKVVHILKTSATGLYSIPYLKTHKIPC